MVNFPNPLLIQYISLPMTSCYRLLTCLILTAGISFLSACTGGHHPDNSSVPEKKVISGSEGDLFSKQDFIQKLSASLHALDTLDSVFVKRGVTTGNALAYTYLKAGYQPLWLEEHGVTEAAGTFISELDSLQYDGLDPEKYHYAKLTAALQQLKSGKAGINEVIAFDTLCTKSYLKASHDLLFGSINPKVADDQWFHINDTAWTAPTALYSGLQQKGQYVGLNSYRPAISTYSMLQSAYRSYQLLAKDAALADAKSHLGATVTPGDSALQYIISKEIPWAHTEAGDSLDDNQQMVRQFQDYNGLAPTGRADSTTISYLARRPDSVLNILAANMERLRWLPRQFEEQYILVNVPLMELYYKKGTENAFNMRVVVGKPARQTPSLNAYMANVVFSPPWGVPPTILKKDVLPGITKRGGNYLARKGLKAYDRRGKMVSSSSITAKNYRSFSFRQPPGARNALGEVKFNLPNKWDIYLHDTPHREDFVKRYRARSSGCVRVERPRDFAEFILKDLEGRNFDQQIIDSIIQTRNTRFETLSKKIPVHIIYLTAFENSDGNHMRLLNDIYHRDSKLIAALRN